MSEKEEFIDVVQRLSSQFDVPLTQEEINQLYVSMKELTKLGEGEDIIRDDYEQYDPGTLEYRVGLRDGIVRTLDTLGIKIEGVNAE